MKTKETLQPVGEPLFPDVGSFNDFMKVAEYFGEACKNVNSVYISDPDCFEGEVVLFSRGEVFYFKMIEIENALYLKSLETMSLIL